jgi:hypothetical protein
MMWIKIGVPKCSRGARGPAQRWHCDFGTHDLLEARTERRAATLDLTGSSA